MGKNDDQPPKGSWWTISEASLLFALREVESGKTADQVMMEMYLQSEHHDYRDSDDLP